LGKHQIARVLGVEHELGPARNPQHDDVFAWHGGDAGGARTVSLRHDVDPVLDPPLFQSTRQRLRRAARSADRVGSFPARHDEGDWSVHAGTIS
jgi:hypothetical protein